MVCVTNHRKEIHDYRGSSTRRFSTRCLCKNLVKMKWTMDESGRMFLNGISTNIHSGQRSDTPRKTEVFQTPPPTPRQYPLEEEDDGIIHLNRILPLDPTYEDSTDLLSCGKPKPPHDFDQETLTEESPLGRLFTCFEARVRKHSPCSTKLRSTRRSAESM